MNFRTATSWAGLAALTTATVLALAGIPAMATAEGGSVTGRIVWCAAAPIPLGAAVPGVTEGGAPPAPVLGSVAPQLTQPPGPAAPDQQAPAPGVSVPDQPGPGGVALQIYPRPFPSPKPIPAGAVLVAVQGTSLNTRTDESGQFRLDSVPVGQYLTVGAGPVSGLSTAVIVRPNVFVSASGKSVDLGTLTLGQCFLPFGGPLAAGAAGSADTGFGVAVPNAADQSPAPDQRATDSNTGVPSD